MTKTTTLNLSMIERLDMAALATKALARQENFNFSSDPSTNQFCRDYLSQILTEANLTHKARQELDRAPWRPLGTILVIISENDVLGTTLAFLAAFITGNKLVIKARDSIEILQFLKHHLKLTNDEAKIIDWVGGEQDDSQLLQGIDGVILAGSSELISHYRSVTPPNIRLVEFVPKLSAMALSSTLVEGDLPYLTDKIILEVTLFLQQVCSSPRFILLESEEIARQIFSTLKEELPSLPSLGEEASLAQSVKFKELVLLKQAQAEQANCLLDAAFDPTNGWGITLCNEFKPDLWFTKGFQLVVGSVDAHLKIAHKLWPNSLQTLGLAGYYDFSCAGFTRFCPLGSMHQRPLNAPHDGFFEFASFVTFLSKEI